MLASVAKWMAWYLGRTPSPAAGQTPPPKRVNSRNRQGKRRSQPRPSPLAERRVTRIRQPRRVGLAAAARASMALATPRPKAATLAPKRTPKPRHVWLETRAPASQPACAVVVALPVRRKPLGDVLPAAA